MTVTTKTADLLANMAFRLVAISDAVYVTDKDIAASINAAASRLSLCAAELEKRLERYEKSASTDGAVK